jgi:gas vesicle protein
MMANGDEDRGVLLSVLAGIGIGVLVGAVAGLLLAPKSGEDIREDLGRSVSDLSDKVTELGRQVGQKMSSVVDRTRASVAQKLGEIPTEQEEVTG